MLPLNWSKINFKKGEYNGIGTYATSHNYPLIMSFSVEENAVFIDEFSKNLPTVGGGTPPPPPRSLPRILPPPPLRLNPGYATGPSYSINFAKEVKIA